ncbi:FtsX-like permease family protein [Rossellomorea marisflavi]|uniref:FtsX-like permease family protein n=1 Tax=Rossellomorea marisflavi TaxID=189381 RepID=UPI003CF35151
MERSKVGLTFSLAMNSMLAHAKQNIMVLGIVVALTFATVFSTVLYYNIASDQTAFLDIFGSEPANVMLTVDPDADTSEVSRSIREMDHVRKVNLFDLIETKVDGQTVYTNVTNRYDELENDVVYEGRQPQHENEISISWVRSDQIGKTIGDSVEVENGGKRARYLITGLSQSIGNLGQVGALTLDGMKEMHPDYQGSTLFVYLDGVENKPFIRSVQDTLGDQIVDPLDIDENIKSQTGMYTAAIFAVMLMVLAITVLVVVMILYLVIKTLIIKRKTEFGVMKAIGYSTLQIMNQISLSFLPVIAGGVAIGGVIGYFFTNPMLSVLLSGAGVKRLAFNVEPFVILLPCVGILIVAYVVSMLVARRIRKISAYGLMTE